MEAAARWSADAGRRGRYRIFLVPRTGLRRHDQRDPGVDNTDRDRARLPERPPLQSGPRSRRRSHAGARPHLTYLTYPSYPSYLSYHSSMIRRPILSLAALAAVVLPFSVLAQQAVTPNELARAVRRDVPMTNTIRRAFTAGTRDNTGRPGPNYWQLQTDYTINVRVDPATQTLTGSETIVLANNSPDTLRQIYIRLDHN